MATQKEVIQKFMKFLDRTERSGEDTLNRAIRACSSFKNFNNIKESLLKDLKGAKSTEYFLKNFCGIDFATKDSGAITGSDAGNSKTKTDEDIISESGSLNTKFRDKSFTVSNLTVELADNKSFNSLSDAEKFIWQGLYTWWIKNALNLITESYGDNFGFGKKSSATTNKLYVEFINDSNKDNIATSISYDEETGETTKITMTINMHDYASLKDDLDEANSEFDRTIAHELTYAAMYANMLYEPVFKSLTGLVIEGLAELAIGIKNSNADAIKNLAADISKFEVGLDSRTLSRDEDFMYEGGYIFFRYLARQAGDLTIANGTADTLVQTFRGNDTIENSANNVTITSGDGKDSIKTQGEKILVNAGTGHDRISANVTKSTVNADAGNDYIYLAANTSNNTLKGGAGKDSIYSSGENILINADDANDYIQLNSGAKNTTVNGGKGKDSVSNEGANILINADAGNDYIQLYSGATNNTVNGGKDKDEIHSSGSNILIRGDADDDYIQLYEKAKNNTVSGGAGKDSIYSGAEATSINADADNDYIHIYSYAKTNTVIAGAGNDSIKSYCENGVLYKYSSGDGNDSISTFTAKDTLSISGADEFSSTKSGNDVILTINDGKITLEGAAKLSSINITGSASASDPTYLRVTDSTKSPITLDSAIKTVNASVRTKKLKIKGNSLDNTINGGSNKDLLYGGAGNDSLVGNAGNDKLQGNGGNDILDGGDGNDKLQGKGGNDTLKGGAGNDTLTGEEGDDVFIYSAGNDVITDYAIGEKISLGSAISKASIKGNDVILTIGSGSLTVKKFKDRTLSFIDSSGKSFSTIVSSGNVSTLLAVSDSTRSPVTVGSAVKMVDASARTKTTKITGSEIANTILGGSGNDSIYGNEGDDNINGNLGDDKIYGNDGADILSGGGGNDTLYGGADDDSISGNVGNDILISGSGNDTLWGGAGNDSLWGGAGNDVFIYEAGNDLIADFANGDILQITGTFSATYNESAKEIAFKVGSTANAITLKNFTAKNFNINGDTYTLSGKNLVKK